MSEILKKSRFYHPSGFKRYPRREVKIDKDTGLKYIGFIRDSKGKNLFDDWYEKIQKPKDSCNVRLLLERAVETDNTAILNQRQKVSADLSNLPDNLTDVLNSFQAVKNYFEMLPTDIKKDFSNNVYEFVKRSGKLSQSTIDYLNSKNSNLTEPINNDDKNNDKGDSE